MPTFFQVLHDFLKECPDNNGMYSRFTLTASKKGGFKFDLSFQPFGYASVKTDDLNSLEDQVRKELQSLKKNVEYQRSLNTTNTDYYKTRDLTQLDKLIDLLRERFVRCLEPSAFSDCVEFDDF